MLIFYFNRIDICRREKIFLKYGVMFNYNLWLFEDIGCCMYICIVCECLFRLLEGFRKCFFEGYIWF